MVSIQIKKVSKRFGATLAVDDVSLAIAAGELFFLLGPSGCGKTTLLRMIAGFYAPDEGAIYFDDRDISRVPPHERNTGMVFQNYALWPHMTVSENLAFGLEMHGIARDERQKRVQRVLAMVEMEELAGRSPNQLSGGQQQRVALARALVLEPDVVLMDEPLANLDAKLRLGMREQIKRIHEELGLTMVYVTHDQVEALSMADRIGVIERGGVAQVGTPREIYNHPRTRFVAGFIGEANLLEGTVAACGTEAMVETAQGRLVAGVFPADLAVGEPVSCCIRPERVEVLAGGEKRRNVLEGTLSRAMYLGSYEQYFVRVRGEQVMRAMEYRQGHQEPACGQRVRLGCDTDDVVVLRQE